MGRIEEKKQEKKQQKKEESDLGSYLALLGVAAIVAVLLWFFASGGGGAVAEQWDGVSVLEGEENPTVVAENATAEDAEEMVEVVYYTDYGCPVCAAFDTQGFKDRFLSNHVETGDVKLVVKPVHFTDGGTEGDSFNYGVAHYAVWEDSPEDWPQWHSQVMTNQEGRSGWGNPGNVESMTEPIDGIDAAGVASSVESAEYGDEVRANSQEARREGVTGTPGFVVGDTTITGLPEDWSDQMASAIEEERQRMESGNGSATDEDTDDGNVTQDDPEGNSTGS